MDPWTILAIIVAVALTARLAAAMRRQRVATQGALPMRRGGRDGLAKVEFLIEHCRQSLDPAKLRRGNERYTSYYIGYVYEVARFIADDEGVAFSTAFQTPILLEAIRLCDSSRVAQGGRLIPSVLASAAGREGAAAGRADAAQALDPRYGGPYWTRIQRYFEAARSNA